jgi:hypothetical protein
MRVTSPASESYRVELVLRKPRIGWYPKPTVVVDGRGHPAQWGSGTWQVPEGSNVIGVFLFNRIWRYGRARFELSTDRPATLTYTAPLLPFLPGRLRSTGARRSA